jgi:hypothetical protein
MPAPEFWEFSVPAVATSLAAIGTVWLTNRRTNRRVDATSVKVDEAIALSKPTGNGFAQDMRDGVRAIRDEQHRQAVHLARLDGTVAVLASLAGGRPPAPTPTPEDQP